MSPLRIARIKKLWRWGDFHPEISLETKNNCEQCLKDGGHSSGAAGREGEFYACYLLEAAAAIFLGVENEGIAVEKGDDILARDFLLFIVKETEDSAIRKFILGIFETRCDLLSDQEIMKLRQLAIGPAPILGVSFLRNAQQ
jgi:hypothetical protein